MAFLPPVRSASSAKSTIMMPFFFTMPISRMMPMMATISRSRWNSMQRQQRAHARRWQRGKNRDRMDEALVQHAENDIDGHQRRQNQQAFVRERALEGSGRSLIVGDHAGRQIGLRDYLFHGIQRLPERVSGTQIEGDGDCRELPFMSDGKRLALGLEVREGAQRNRSLNDGGAAVPPAAAALTAARGAARGGAAAWFRSKMWWRWKRCWWTCWRSTRPLALVAGAGRRGQRGSAIHAATAADVVPALPETAPTSMSGGRNAGGGGGRQQRVAGGRRYARTGARGRAGRIRCRRRRSAAGGRRLDIDIVQLLRIELELRVRLQNHVILIQLRVERVDLALPERVVERVVDGLPA